MAPEGESLQRGVRAAGGIGVRLDLSLDVDCMLSGLNFLLHQLPRRRSSASPSLAPSLASQALRLTGPAPRPCASARRPDLFKVAMPESMTPLATPGACPAAASPATARALHTPAL